MVIKQIRWLLTESTTFNGYFLCVIFYWTMAKKHSKLQSHDDATGHKCEPVYMHPKMQSYGNRDTDGSSQGLFFPFKNKKKKL